MNSVQRNTPLGRWSGGNAFRVVGAWIATVLVCCIPTSRSRAQDSEGAGEPRTALVIGCSYAGSNLQLPSPESDASRIASLLKAKLGFQATLLINPDRKQLLEAVDQFGEALSRRGGVGLFYFSGHGAQHEGENYLIPERSSIGFREDLPTEAVSARRVVTRMENAKNPVNLLFLDACRNNPLPSSRQKGLGEKGLAGMNAASGMLVGFATAPNTPAHDSGAGSFYTNALIECLALPGMSVTDMLTKVNAKVRKQTGGVQVPFMEVGLSDVFYLAGRNLDLPSTADAGAAPPSRPHSEPQPPAKRETVVQTPPRNLPNTDEARRRMIDENRQQLNARSSGPVERRPPVKQSPAPQRAAAPPGNPVYARAVPGKPGFVLSPFAPNSGYVDVRGFPPGTEVKDPYTNKMFLVP